jgi:glycosyltransferase involved in cell wall biosynthesis
VGVQLRAFPEYRQVAISLGTDGPGAEDYRDGSVLLVNGQGLSWSERAWLHAPERVRRARWHGIGGAAGLTYCWNVLRELPRLRPRLVVCYDAYKLGPLLRRIVDWPCRLVYSQHGLTYNLTAAGGAELYSLQSFDVFWVLTKASYRIDRARYAVYEPEVAVLPNGVDVDRFRPATGEERHGLRREFGLPESDPVVLYFSRLVAKKGIHLVVESWPNVLKEVPSAHLWIVGGGDPAFRRALEHRVEAMGIRDRVRFQGPVPAEEAERYYRAADAFVFPTLWGEGMAFAILEALACGLGAVVAEHDGAREMYSDEEVLFVRDPNLAGAFVEPLVKLLNNPSLRASLGARGRRRIEQQHSAGAALERIRRFYARQLSLVGERT